MASGDTKTNQYLDIAANGTRADLPSDTCCETRSQTLIREVAERIMDVEDEVEELKNNPDVVDIVATYADLQAYDTQHLTDKDIIRVLQDETHDGESTYYRYNKQSDTWTYVGESKQYTDFVGTDGTTAGTAGLVPAPAATDTDKYLKSDGTWAEVQGGGGGTSNFNQLTNRPSYNNTTMTGSTNIPKVPTATSELTNDSGFITSSALPTVNDATLTITQNGTSKGTFTANDADDTTIALTDTTYSDFTGTDGSSAGAAGLVPAPATTDADKFLKSDGDWTTISEANTYIISGSGAPTTATVGTVGMIYEDTTNGKLYQCTAVTPGTDPDPDTYTWSEVGSGGSGPTVVQTTGTSTTDVMSQNAVTSMVFADPATMQKIKIGAGASTSEGLNALEIGYNSVATAPNGVALGSSAFATSTNGATAIGANSSASGINSIAISGGWQGAYAESVGAINIGGGGSSRSVTGQGAISLGIYTPANSVQGKIEVGSTNTSYGYNSSNYRLLSGVHDGQSAHDAATKGQLDSIAIQNAGAPTTSTVGTVGQLLEDTTNGKLYQCTAVDTTDPQNPSYTWSEVGAGGGGGPTVVQTTGTSTTDVMSQNAVTSMVFADPATMQKIKIGAGTSTNEGTHAVEIGEQSSALGNYSVALGYDSTIQSAATSAISILGSVSKQGGIALIGGAHGRNAIAIGASAYVDGENSIALGAGATTSTKGVISINTTNIGSTAGYNSSQYRLITGLYDPQSAHDAATKGYVDPTTDSSAPTTATVGRLGQIFIDTTNADAYMCVDATNPYVWKKLTP